MTARQLEIIQHALGVDKHNCLVTDAGKQAMRDLSPPAPKLTRGQARYRAYLRADTGGTFKEWLQGLR